MNLLRRRLVGIVRRVKIQAGYTEGLNLAAEAEAYLHELCHLVTLREFVGLPTQRMALHDIHDFNRQSIRWQPVRGSLDARWDKGEEQPGVWRGRSWRVQKTNELDTLAVEVLVLERLKAFREVGRYRRVHGRADFLDAVEGDQAFPVREGVRRRMGKPRIADCANRVVRMIHRQGAGIG